MREWITSKAPANGPPQIVQALAAGSAEGKRVPAMAFQLTHLTCHSA